MGWSPEQLSNAKVIIQVGRQLGASDRDITIALMAGWQESGLRNLNYGDRDSIGMFQQRNAWGSRSDRMDPVKSARMFFLGGAQGQRGLLDFKNRDSYSLGQAAQKVQVSAYPDAYDKWQDESEQLLKELGGSSSHPSIPALPTTPPGETTQMPTVQPVEPPAPTTALGLGSPTSMGTEAVGLAAQGAPGLESADEQPAMPTYSDTDLMSMFDAAKPATPDFKAPTGTDVFGGNDTAKGNYSLPGVKSYVLGAANELGGRFGIKTIGGVGDRPNESDHPGGKALDFMTRGKNGNDLAAFAEANWKRLNIKYIIWNQHIWNPSRAGEGWRLMEDRGGDTANHRDHVHISFN
jgi:hypothetical protein